MFAAAGGVAAADEEVGVALAVKAAPPPQALTTAAIKCLRVRFVIEALVTSMSCRIMREHTLARNRLSARSVINGNFYLFKEIIQRYIHRQSEGIIGGFPPCCILTVK